MNGTNDVSSKRKRILRCAFTCGIHNIKIILTNESASSTEIGKMRLKNFYSQRFDICNLYDNILKTVP